MIILYQFQETHFHRKPRHAMTTIKKITIKIESMFALATISTVAATAYFALTTFIA